MFVVGGGVVGVGDELVVVVLFLLGGEGADEFAHEVGEAENC